MAFKDIDAYAKDKGIEFPKNFIFTKEDWMDFYKTLVRFKRRCLQRKYRKVDLSPIKQKEKNYGTNS